MVRSLYIWLLLSVVTTPVVVLGSRKNDQCTVRTLSEFECGDQTLYTFGAQTVSLGGVDYNARYLRDQCSHSPYAGTLAFVTCPEADGLLLEGPGRTGFSVWLRNITGSPNSQLFFRLGPENEPLLLPFVPRVVGQTLSGAIQSTCAEVDPLCCRAYASTSAFVAPCLVEQAELAPGAPSDLSPSGESSDSAELEAISDTSAINAQLLQQQRSDTAKIEELLIGLVSLVTLIAFLAVVTFFAGLWTCIARKDPLKAGPQV